MEDKRIVELYWERSEQAIAETAAKYGPYCHYISYNILHSHEDAEECVNDTYAGAWNAMPPHQPSRLATFLGKITRNLSLNRRKQYQAVKRGQGQTELALAELEECVPDGQNVESQLEERQLVACIESFLEALPQMKRKVFVRRYWYLSPVGEIAAQYGMSESKVTSMLFRLRRELKVRLEQEGILL